MLTTGKCLCGNVRIQFTGVPKRRALCHCDTCQHYTGSVYSINIVVENENFTITQGAPKELKLIADNGKSITNCFCGDCGTTIYRYGDSFGGIDGDKVIQGGVLGQGVLDANGPGLEMFIENRVDWVPSLGNVGVAQFEGMPPPPPAE